jgi:1-acyl-sn-glycerol-3-phosphate acyltransferase
MIRAVLVGVFFFAMTPILISIQWLLDKAGLPGWGFIACNYYRVLRAILRIRVSVKGKPVRGRAALFVSNHVSWVDIVVIGSLSPVAFVAKSDVRKWPLVGITAKVQRTVFVDRGRRHQAADAIGEIVARLRGGTSVVLFAEGTSSDGNRVLPFRSALLGAITHAANHAGAAANISIQPMSICYTGQHGIPMGRQHRPLVAWYGDLDFMPHIRDFIAHGAVDAVVCYAAPVPADRAADRKTLTKMLEGAVREITAATLRGRTPPAPGATNV